MAILSIIKAGDPVLRSVATEVKDCSSPDIVQLCEDMIATMYAMHGVGLAAPQVGYTLRVFVYHIPVARSDDGVGIAPRALINPSIQPLGEEMDKDYEGCLSLPGLMGEVSRYCRIRVQGFLSDGTFLDEEVQGFHARVIQHEYDHLNGVLYLDRMSDFLSFGYREEIMAQVCEKIEEKISSKECATKD